MVITVKKCHMLQHSSARIFDLLTPIDCSTYQNEFMATAVLPSNDLDCGTVFLLTGYHAGHVQKQTEDVFIHSVTVSSKIFRRPYCDLN